MQLNFNELENTPVDFLEEITDKEFLRNIADDNDATPNPQKKARPAIEINPDGPPQESAAAFNPIGPENTNVNAREIISGELATDLMDKILPVIVSIVARKFMDLEVPKKQFQLTASEKSTIAPIMDKCLSTLNISFENPFYALLASLTFIYGSKVIDIANNPEFTQAAKKVTKATKDAHRPENPQPAGFGSGNVGSRGQALTRKAGETRGRKAKPPVKLNFN
jgi:hypothetical protein